MTNTKVFENGLIPGDALAMGIDPSLTGFGLSFVSMANPDQHETLVYSSPHRGVRRLKDITDWINDKIDYIEENNHEIINVAIEAAILSSPSSLPLGELAGAVKLALYKRFDDDYCRFPLKIPPMTLKKYAAGKGNAKKQEMLLQIYKRWGLEFNDDNAADAYALGRLASGVYINKVEEETIEKISDPKYRDYS